MKGFIDEFEEKIADLTSRLAEKDTTIRELKEELKKKDDENKIALTEVFEENQKLKEQIDATNLALVEIYESTLDENA